MTLQLWSISHSYDSAALKARQVLTDIDWQVERGQQFLLRGVSGSGKTTLFNIIAGLMRPTNGQVLLNSTNIYDLNEAKRDLFRSSRIGYVFQTHYLLNTLTAAENVMMPMVYRKKLSKAEREDRATFLMTQVGLEAFKHYLPRQLSTGQRMRVAVARALANEPTLLLADEPTASLDEESANQVMDLMQEIAQTNNSMLVVSSHDPTLLSRFEHHATIEHGHINLQEIAAQ